MSNTSRLIECYQYCSKYFSDNQASLQSCYRRCDAMWGSKTSASTDIKSFETCFPNSIYGLEDFMDKYRRIGRSSFEDWQIVAEISSIIGKMLEEGRQNKCPSLNEAITDAINKALNELGIDRYSITKGYLHGMNDEVRQLLTKNIPKPNRYGNYAALYHTNRYSTK